MYQLARCRCGNHVRERARRRSHGKYGAGLMPHLSETDGISRVLQWRERVREYHSAGSVVGSSSEQSLEEGHDKNHILSRAAKETNSLIFNVGVDMFSRFLKVKSGEGEERQNPNPMASSTTAPPNHNIYFAHTAPGYRSIGNPQFALQHIVPSIEERIETDAMSPIKWKVTYEGSPHNSRLLYKGCDTPEDIPPCPLIESAMSYSVADDVARNTAPRATTTYSEFHNTMRKANEASVPDSEFPAKVPIDAPKTPSPRRFKLVFTPYISDAPSTITTSATTSIAESGVFNDANVPSAARRRSTRASKPSSKAIGSDLTLVPAPTHTLKRKAASDNTSTQDNQPTKSGPKHTPKKRGTTTEAVSGIVEPFGKATD